MGIDEISIASPNHYIDCGELAEFRDVPKGKILKGLGCKKFAVPYNCDIDDLAVQSLQGLNFDGVRKFYFASESFPDLSKPLASRVLPRLGINEVETRDMRFACVGGAQCLLDAMEHTAFRQEPSIIITSDRAVYKDGGSEEFTQGAASVAMKITENPSLLELSVDNTVGSYIEDVDDFRVHPDDYPYPRVDGKLSIIAYLHTMKNAYESWVRHNNIHSSPLDYFDYFVFHAPFPKMVKKAFSMLYRRVKTDIEHLSVEDFLENPEKFREDRSSRKKVMEMDGFQKTFKNKVEPAIKYLPKIGNCYTSSVLIGLATMIEHGQTDEKVAIGGYGSGAGAVAFDGEIKTDGFTLNGLLDGRNKLEIEEYTEWRKEL